MVICGAPYDFFSFIADVSIDATNEDLQLNPPSEEDDLLRRIIDGMGAYTRVDLQPMLMMPNRTHPDLTPEKPRAAKTIPAHFSPVERVDTDDVARIFGHESHGDGRTFFQVGEPLNMDDIPLCLNLPRFVERPNAVFGKTGARKTFLTASSRAA